MVVQLVAMKLERKEGRGREWRVDRGGGASCRRRDTYQRTIYIYQDNCMKYPGIRSYRNDITGKTREIYYVPNPLEKLCDERVNL